MQFVNLALKTGDTAVIFGLAQLSLIVEAAAGASKIYAVELSPNAKPKQKNWEPIVVRPEGETIAELSTFNRWWSRMSLVKLLGFQL